MYWYQYLNGKGATGYTGELKGLNEECIFDTTFKSSARANIPVQASWITDMDQQSFVINFSCIHFNTTIQP